MSTNTKPRPQAAPARTEEPTAGEGTAPAQTEAKRRDRGLLVVLGGRGQTGKSVEAKWAVDRANSGGRTAVPADGDRFNQTLRANFPDALYPHGAEAEKVGAWLHATADWAALERVAIVADMGGGDREFATHGGDLLKKGEVETFDDLAGWGLGDLGELQGSGLDVTPIYAMSGGYDDTSGLAMLLRRKLVTDRTILLLNAGTVRGQDTPEGAVALLNRVLAEDSHVKAAIEAGANPVVMPGLYPGIADWVERYRMRFSAAIKGEAPEGGEPLNLAERQVLVRWLRDMERAHAAVAHLLP